MARSTVAYARRRSWRRRSVRRHRTSQLRLSPVAMVLPSLLQALVRPSARPSREAEQPQDGSRLIASSDGCHVRRHASPSKPKSHGQTQGRRTANALRAVGRLLSTGMTCDKPLGMIEASSPFISSLQSTWPRHDRRGFSLLHGGNVDTRQLRRISASPPPRARRRRAGTDSAPSAWGWLATVRNLLSLRAAGRQPRNHHLPTIFVHDTRWLSCY
jgi:hypothetical protein